MYSIRVMKKVLFVCAENKKRSQMAEAIFNHLAKEPTATSAGTFPSSAVDTRTKKVLQEIGIEAKNIRPKLLTNDMLDSADLIVSFGCINSYIFPEKKFQEWTIKDPTTLEELRLARDEILARVKTLL